MITTAIACLLAPSTLTIKTPVGPLSISGTKPYAVELVFANQTSKDIQVWHCGFWPNHRVHLADAAGKAVSRTTFGSQVDGRFGTPERDKNLAVPLKPGAKHVYATPDLRKLFVLKPGTYSLRIEYGDSNFASPLTVVCQTVKLEVKP